MMRFVYFFLIILSCLACNGAAENKKDDFEDRQESVPENAQVEKIIAAEPSQRKAIFYEVTAQRPDEICGKKGFTYLAEGYLFKECGACHYSGNQFRVTDFAVKGDVDHSYTVMATIVDKVIFVEATIKNRFCSECLLKQKAPLLADLLYFADHVSDEQCKLLQD